MRFIGIDLAWGHRNSTAAVTLEWLPHEERLITSAHADCLRTDQDILDYVRHCDNGGGLVIGIDAPLDVPNENGERPVEAILRRSFGKYHAGAHPANRALLGDPPRGEWLAAQFESEFGIASSFELSPGDTSVRACLEVFPHPAHVALFELEKTLKYKAKPGRTAAMRDGEFIRLENYLASLSSFCPALVPPVWLRRPPALRGAALKRYEDLLDALCCAYVAGYYWYWGDGERCMVIGDKTSGYVVTPITPLLRARVAAAQTIVRELARPAAETKELRCL